MLKVVVLGCTALASDFTPDFTYSARCTDALVTNPEHVKHKRRVSQKAFSYTIDTATYTRNKGVNMW